MPTSTRTRSMRSSKWRCGNSSRARRLMSSTHNEVFASKKQLWLLCPKQADLTHSELLVYSYRAWQDTWQEKPAILKVVKATGLSRNTVRKADRRLQTLGLMDNDHTIHEPPEGAFMPANRDGDHWFKRLQYWVCYVRRPDAALTHIQTALLSFLWHCHATGFHPHFSCAYLATVLCVHRETMADALRALDARGLLTYTTHERGITFNLRQLNDVSFLQDGAQPRSISHSDRTVNHAQSVVVSETTAPTRAVLPPAYSRTGEDLLMNTVTREGIASKLRRFLPQDADQLASELVNTRAYNGDDRWGWYLEFNRMVSDHERDPAVLINKLRQNIHGEWNGATK